MVALAVALADNGAPWVVDLVERMLAAAPHRGPQRQLVRPAASLCLGLGHSLATAPSAETSCVMDARLDNRQELAAALGVAPDLPDAALLRAGFQQWGVDLADRLRGDFALVLWDERSSSLYAARDAFGVRPLFYHHDGHRLLLASEVSQLVAVGAATGIEAGVVLDYLQLRYTHAAATFFQGIRRLPPGYWLSWNRNGLRLQRYWLPPARDLLLVTQADYDAEFRRLLQAAVADRLEKDRPLVAHLSGGLDSTAIVCVADQFIGKATGHAPVHAVSFTYAGLACDETRYIEAAAQGLRLPVHRFPGAAAATFAAPEPDISQPDWTPMPKGSESDVGLAETIGAVGILTGSAGDELLFEDGVLTDLVRQRRWLTLLAQTVGARGWYSVQGRFAYLGQAVRGELPGWLRRLYRRVRPARQPPSPDWLGPRLLPLWAQPDEQETGVSRLPSATQQAAWDAMTSPVLWWPTEWEVLRAARHGLDMRYPYLDRRLVDFILATPYERRLPRGRMKRFLRDPLRDLVPALVRDRTRVTSFDCLRGLDWQANRGLWQSILHDGAWLAQPFVDRPRAQAWFAFLDKTCHNWFNSPNVAILRALVHLELWLRSLQSKRLLPPLGG